MCSFQLLMGKVYKFYPVKPIFLSCVLLFEVGSAICGAAPNSTAFIIGRAISGLGSSGMFSGLMVILFHTIPLRQRPLWQGAFGAVFAVASVVGPLMGGAFTDHVTWRWCFYINLPVGAISILVTTFILDLKNQKLDATGVTFMDKLKQLDPIGNLAFFPGIICLVLALQWGGTKYAWSDGRIIAMLVLCGVLILVFAGIQVWKKEEATVPPRIVTMRSMAAAIFFAFFSGSSAMVLMYYLPLWFQAIKGVDATKSGIMLLPMIMSVVVGSISSGALLNRVGYYGPFFILASILMPIGAGLMTTFTPTTAHPSWIGFQVIFGLGFGISTTMPLNVPQTILKRSDVATGSAIILFVRFLGPAIFLPVGQNLFLNDLVSSLSNIQGITAEDVTQAGATSLRALVSGENLKLLLADYNHAVVKVFYMVTGVCAVTILGSLSVEWKSIKKQAKEQQSQKMEESEKGVKEPAETKQ